MKSVTMGISSSNLVDQFEVSAQISRLEEPDADGARVRVKSIGTAPCNPSSVVNRTGKGQVQPVASRRAGTPEDDELTKSETDICSLQGAPETWRLLCGGQLRALPSLPSVDAPTTVPNCSSFEADAWIPTPSLRRPSDPLSNRTKFLIASATAALAGYYVFASSDQSVDVAVVPQPAIETQ